MNQETINSVVIDILKGVKETGTEIYGVTKEGLVKAVDFAQEQVPLVIQEFLTWKFYEALIELVCSFGILGLIGGFVYMVFRHTKNIKDDFDRWALRTVIFVFSGIFIVPISTRSINLRQPINTMVQIKVAPRVYMIEYVADKTNLSPATPVKKS